MPGSGIAGSYGNYICSFFKGSSTSFSIVVVPIYIPTHNIGVFPFMHTLSNKLRITILTNIWRIAFWSAMHTCHHCYMNFLYSPSKGNLDFFFLRLKTTYSSLWPSQVQLAVISSETGIFLVVDHGATHHSPSLLNFPDYSSPILQKKSLKTFLV